MNIRIWTGFEKRHNSTKVPPEGDEGQSVTVRLKGPCSIKNPIFILHRYYVNANYVKFDNKYYFVTDKIYLSNDEMELHCSMDVLGSYKTKIGNTSAFVVYDTTTNDKHLIDTRLSASTKYTTKKNTTPFLAGNINQTGTCILTFTGKDNSGITAIQPSHLDLLLPNDSSVNAQWDNIVGDVSTAGVSETLKKVIRYLTSYGTIAENIQSLIWIPFNVYTAGSNYLTLGGYETNLVYSPIDIRHIEWTDTINIPWVYTDWRKNYSTIYLTIPFIGTQQYSGASLYEATTITLRSVLDKYTGEISTVISANGGGANRIIGNYTYSTAANINIGISNGFNSARFANSLISGFGGGMLSAISGSSPRAGIGSAINGLASTNIQTTSTSIGNFSGETSAFALQNVECVVVAHDTSDNPTDMNPVIGTPEFQVKLIKDAPGYIECSNASVSISGDDTVRNEINSLMNSGFYYE